MDVCEACLLLGASGGDVWRFYYRLRWCVAETVMRVAEDVLSDGGRLAMGVKHSDTTMTKQGWRGLWLTAGMKPEAMGCVLVLRVRICQRW